MRFLLSRRAALLATLGLLFGLAACSDDDRAASSTTGSPSTDVSATTNTSTDAPSEQQVLDAYRAFWDAYLEAADPMNPQHPALAEHATGEELQQVSSAFLARLSAGEVIRGDLELAPEVVSLDGTTATLSDCYLDHTGIYDAATGERRDQESGVRHLVTVGMALEEGSWKVASITREGDGCTPGTTS